MPRVIHVKNLAEFAARYLVCVTLASLLLKLLFGQLVHEAGKYSDDHVNFEI